MRKLLLSALIFGICYASEAQIDPLYAQYLSNPLLINPAYSGLNNNLNIGVTYRKQWAGFDGSPATYNVNGHTSLLDNRMGVGLIVVRDNIGINSNTEVHATYAYRLPLDQQYLSFGLQAGLLSYKSINSELNPFDPNDPAFQGSESYTRPSFGAGVILHSERYFFGLSVPRMLKAQVTISDLETELYSQHFYAMGSYVFFLNEHIRLKPSVLLKSVEGSPVSTDVNFSVNLNERYTAGIYTRNLNAFGLLAQMKFADMYRFGYAFEVPSRRSVGARFTTHEVSFGLNMAMFAFHRASITNF
ncbi:MAG TPA: type IX secretion system membrane protein PorP/SprF [Chryseosolibacter sp.]|nr:type IX secretion system membrane protein PorP/SprF [Chryseosolibacter sp.]